MLDAEHEWEQHHLRVLVETAQRAGRSEREIRALVDPYFTPAGRARAERAPEEGLLRRLLRIERRTF